MGSCTWALDVVPESEANLVLTAFSVVWVTCLISLLPGSFLPRKEEGMVHVGFIYPRPHPLKV